jgi:hypothetical protein
MSASTQILRYAASHVQHMQKALEQMNVKLSSRLDRESCQRAPNLGHLEAPRGQPV